jgi:hypothetical protein
MDENYWNMMRQTLKASGLSDAQIEQTLEAQKAAMRVYGNVDGAALRQAAAGMEGYMKNMAAALGDSGADSYFAFAEKPSINKSYQWAVACGADLIHLRGDIINDLGTGTDKETVLEILSAQWGINSKKDFIEMAESLKQGRHSVIYHKLAAGEAVEGFEEEADNLKQAAALFKKDKLTAKSVPDMLIWDLGRLINISRFAFDGKLITRKEALGYLKEAALLVKKHYASWKDLSVAYQFGRAVWGGPDEDEYEELKGGMEQLLTEGDSPWVMLPFDMELDFDE